MRFTVNEMLQIRWPLVNRWPLVIKLTRRFPVQILCGWWIGQPGGCVNLAQR